MAPTDKNEGPDTVEQEAEAALDTVLHHVALEAKENGESTERSHLWSEQLYRKVQSDIAALRRRQIPKGVTVSHARPLSSEYLALNRDGILARLEALRYSENVRYAHLELQGLSDDDLRRLLATLETAPPTDR